MRRLFPVWAVLTAFLAGCTPSSNGTTPAAAGAAPRFASKTLLTHGTHPYLWTTQSYVEGLSPYFKSNDPDSETGCILEHLQSEKCRISDLTTRAAAISEQDVYLAMTDAVVAFRLQAGRGSPITYAFRSNVSTPDALAFDRAGNLFVASVGVNNVDIFLRSNFSLDTPLSHYIHHGINHPTALVFDRDDSLFVANYASDTVTAYAPTHRAEAFETISHGINKPTTLATDNRGYLYVGNSGSNTVTAYAPGSTAPAYTIVDGINGPSALAIDKNDQLYVANHGGDSVTVYPPDSTTPTLTLRDRAIYHPVGLAVDESLNLYVADGSHVSVFTAPGLIYYGEAVIQCCGKFKGVILGPKP
jgi:DNA-binding beta-propeller fold protein YncE